MKKLTACCLALLLISCSDADQVSLPRQAALSTDNLTFISFNDAAFAAAQKGGQFWAVPGESRTLTLRYADSEQEFMKFEVGPHSLQTTDSVLISVQLDANGVFAFHFSPSGLRFNPEAPARLKINYARASDDVDSDGDVDLLDALQFVNARIWKRELPGMPWLSLPTLQVVGKVEQADIYDFTSFGMAVD
jgi:hypothetical protein